MIVQEKTPVAAPSAAAPVATQSAFAAAVAHPLFRPLAALANPFFRQCPLSTHCGH